MLTPLIVGHAWRSDPVRGVARGEKEGAMHITILALGSRGDVLPCAALGKRLKGAGHQVRVATFGNFEDMVRGRGLDFHPVRGDVQQILNAGAGQALAASGRNPFRMAATALRAFGTMAEGFARDLSGPVLGETDLIVNQLPGGLYGEDLAEWYGVPMVVAAVIPMTPSRHQPMLAFPSRLAPLPGYNIFTHWLAYQLVWQGYRPAVSRWRQQTLGLSKAALWGSWRAATEGRVVLNGFSEHVVPRPADWGPHVHVTGYWFPDEEGWQPPEELCRFIEAGLPPVFIGFGSMSVRDPAETTALLLEAIERSGVRAILHTGWAGVGRQALPDGVFQIEYAPYGWLFPQMAAVVHHGGSGTTAAALRAGVPSIVVPFLFDQFYWGGRVADLGVGPRPIPFKRLSAERLEEAMCVATTNSSMRLRAAALGNKIGAEDGLKEAVEVIQGIIHKQNGGVR